MFRKLIVSIFVLFLFFAPVTGNAQTQMKELPEGILKFGATGDEVKMLQDVLNDAGYALKIDGIYGKETEAAVKEFQEENIEMTKYIDGIYGNYTMKALQQNITFQQESNRIIAHKLNLPWAMDFYKTTIYVTERGGDLTMINGETMTRQTLKLNKKIKVLGEGGLLGFVLDPNFRMNKTAYLYHTYEEKGRILNRVVLVKQIDRLTWSEYSELVAGIPGGSTHNGGRIKIGPDNKLYVTTGDSGISALAQDLSSLGGKILRVNLDGTVPNDNPFPNSYIYSFGHRNPQGLAWDDTGQLYSSEHGPSGEKGWRANDEINKILKGRNYGWPLVHGGEKKEGLESPLFQSGTSTWAPSGLSYHKGKLYVAGLRGAQIREFDLDSKKESVVFDGFGRLRDIRFEGGVAYILTNNRIEDGINDDLLIRVDSFPSK